MSNHNWISVRVELPNEEDWVWLYDIKAGVVKAWRYGDMFLSFNSQYKDVTHWMQYKPSAPEVKNAEE